MPSKVHILNRAGEILYTSHKWTNLSDSKAKTVRDRLHKYPDLGYRAQIVPLSNSVSLYHVYNGTGIWLGSFEPAIAQNMISRQDDYTLSEVIQ